MGRTVTRMIDRDDFKIERRYTRDEVAELLNIRDRWLKEWVSKNLIPHQRKGEVKGVWFTYADIRAIGRMLPELMTNRQANARAEATTQTGPETGQGADTAPTTESTAELAPTPENAESTPGGPNRDGAPRSEGGVVLSAEQVARFRGLRAA